MDKIKHYIAESYDTIMGFDKSHFRTKSVVDGHRQAAEKELEELERLAELGKSIELAFRCGFDVVSNQRVNGIYVMATGETELLNWYKNEVANEN